MYFQRASSRHLNCSCGRSRDPTAINPVVQKVMKIAGLAVSTAHNGGIACTAYFKDMQCLYMKSKRGK